MHRDFRRLLAAAEGVSEFPIAMNVDIRGFSKWSGDSAESGLFIKKVYIRLIDHYLADASFFKATGDGLLAVFPVDEEDPKAAVRKTVDLALAIVDAFPTITDGDPMINFPVPEAVGIGLARGPASRLVSGRKTLDYSGTTLNLASRLMDLARPLGVVLDERFGNELLTPSVAKRFAKKRAYIHGIAPSLGRDVYYTSDWTTIPKSALSPLVDTKWGGGKVRNPRKAWDAMTGNYVIALDGRPKDHDRMRCYVRHAASTKGGRQIKDKWVSLDLQTSEYSFEETAEGPQLKVAVAGVQRAMKVLGGGPNFPVSVVAEFDAL